VPDSTARPSLRRDVRIIGLIAAAHFFSHFFQLTLPPLFPLLKTVFDVPYVALGLAMSVFYGASGIGQTLSGFLVDRVGALRVLLAGMGLSRDRSPSPAWCRRTGSCCRWRCWPAWATACSTPRTTRS
jgi:MFS family permease